MNGRWRRRETGTASSRFIDSEQHCGPSSYPEPVCQQLGNGDFAEEPLATPIETHVAIQLLDHVLHHARAEAAASGRRDRRATGFAPAQDHATSTLPTGTDSAPYFAALVAS